VLAGRGRAGQHRRAGDENRTPLRGDEGHPPELGPDPAGAPSGLSREVRGGLRAEDSQPPLTRHHEAGHGQEGGSARTVNCPRPAVARARAAAVASEGDLAVLPEIAALRADSIVGPDQPSHDLRA
jgi:hypothetical protein